MLSQISTVIVSDLARLGRRPGDNIRVTDQLKDAGITVRVAGQRASELSDLEQRLLLLVAVAEPVPRPVRWTRPL